MIVPDTERECLRVLIHQIRNDLASAHAEICHLQDLDPEKHKWPAWTPQANTLRWVEEIERKFGLQMP